MSKQKDIKAEILALKSKLTGDLLNDAEVQNQIYQLKIILNPEIANRPDLMMMTVCIVVLKTNL